MGGGSKQTTVVPPPTADELELIAINKELGQLQLASLKELAPFQTELLGLASEELNRTAEQGRLFDEFVTPEQQAQARAEDFERAQRLGPIQDELLQLQLEDIRRGGAATPEQLERIQKSTDTAIEAGIGDVDASTSRGIGLIADELANSRGLRLSDSPISSEAALLAREGEIQKGSLIKNLRAAQAGAELNFPLAAQQLLGAQNQSQQGILQAATNFQQDIRQRAFQNRLALTGQAVSGGLGLSSIGPGAEALNSLTNARLGSASRKTSQGIGIGQISQGVGAIGGLAGGVGLGLLGFSKFSDRRLKRMIKRIGTHKLGFGIYKYFIFGVEEQGVMADEVVKVMPKAVTTDKSGYDKVDYQMIGGVDGYAY